MASGYTQAQLDAMKAQFALGISSVTHAGKRVDYRSLDEMERVIARIEAALAADAGTVTVHQVRAMTNKGA